MENRYILNYDLKRRLTTDIRFKQGDIDTSIIQVTIFEGGVVADITGEVIEFRFLKPDNTVVYQDILTGVSILDGTSGKVECVLKSNTLAVSGVVKCEINMSKEGKKLTTPSFYFTVENNIGADGVLSTNYISSIENVLLHMNIAESGRVTEENLRKINEDIRKEEFLNLKSDITAGVSLHTNLQDDITTGSTLDIALKSDITVATIKTIDLANVIATSDLTTYASKGSVDLVMSSLTEKANQSSLDTTNTNISNLFSSLTAITNEKIDYINIKKYSSLVVNKDWTLAIQQAITDMSSAGTIYFPTGTYNHTGIILTKTCNFRGNNKYSSILKNIGFGDSFTINADVEKGTFSHIGVMGNGVGVYAVGATAQRGFVFKNNSVCWNFDNVWMRGHGKAYFFGDGLGNVNNINIQNCELEWGGDCCIHFIQTSGGQMNAISIKNCNFSGFQTNGLELWGQSITVDNCCIQACKGYGVSINGATSANYMSHATAIRIINNYFELCNQGFIFLKATVTPFVRYINGVIIESNYGSYGVIPGTVYNATNTYCVEVQAPSWYAYDNVQISNFIYKNNSFATGGTSKGILNCNNVLSYDSIIHKSGITIGNLESWHVNLGRAKILSDNNTKKIIYGIRSCFSHAYTIEKSPNIIINDTLKYDLFSFITGNFRNITFQVDTDSTDYKITFHRYNRTKNTNGIYTDTSYTILDHQSGSKLFTWGSEGAGMLPTNVLYTDECYVGIQVTFNVTGQTYLYVGNLEVGIFS